MTIEVFTMSLKQLQVDALVPITLIAAYALNWLLEGLGFDTSSGVLYHLVLIVYLTITAIHVSKSTPIRIAVPLVLVIYMVGDFIMGGVISVPSRLIFGMAVFALGHGLAGALTLLHPAYQHFKFDAMKTIITFAVIIALWVVMVFNNQQLVMSLAALAYALILGMNISSSWAAMQRNPYAMYLVYGFGFYTFSDLVIAMKSIKGITIPDPWYGNIVWFTYVIAISLVSYGLLKSLKVTQRSSE